MSDAALNTLIEDFWQWRLRDAPEFASTVGINDYDDKLEDLSVAAYEQRLEKCQTFSKKLASIDASALAAEGKMNHQLLKANLDSFIDNYKWRSYSTYNCINFLENVPLNFSSFIIGAMKFDTAVDFEKYICRLRAISKQQEQQVELMRQAVKAETSCHAVSTEGAIEQLQGLLKAPIDSNDLMKPFKEKLPLIG